MTKPTLNDISLPDMSNDITQTTPTLNEKRSFAKVVNCRDATESGSYPLIRDFGKFALVMIATKRKFQFCLMFPEIAGEDGCRIVKLGALRWKKEANSDFQISQALAQSLRKLQEIK